MSKKNSTDNSTTSAIMTPLMIIARGNVIIRKEWITRLMHTIELCQTYIQNMIVVSKNTITALLVRYSITQKKPIWRNFVNLWQLHYASQQKSVRDSTVPLVYKKLISKPWEKVKWSDRPTWLPWHRSQMLHLTQPAVTWQNKTHHRKILAKKIWRNPLSGNTERIWSMKVLKCLSKECFVSRPRMKLRWWKTV